MKSTVSASTKKPEDNSKQLENIRKQGSNKQCFDCGEKGTTYVVTNFGTFVCSRCAGLIRDLTFKVKGIGVCNFSDTELALLTRMGNDNAKAIWLAKFDSKKEKLPDPKDSEAVRRHITAKYKDKKFAVKDAEKVVNQKDGGKVSSKQTKGKKEESSEDESSEEEVEVEIKKKGHQKNESVTKKEEVKVTQTTTQKKLQPLNLGKNSTQNVNQTQSPNTISSISIGGKKTEETGWANFQNFPNTNSGNNTGSNNGFTFFDNANTNQVQNKAPNSSSKIDQSMFTFTDTGSVNNKKNEWGAVWDNTTSPNTSGNNNNTQSPFDFNFVNSGSTTTSTVTNANTTITGGRDNPLPQDVNSNKNFDNVLNNLNNLGLGGNTSTGSTGNTNINQPSNNRKSLDDLERSLTDPSLFMPIVPTNTTNQPTNTNSSTTNFMHMNQMNMLGVSNNMFMMHPQMMQQMQMMMLNPQMQNNPQMMQFMQMMMQNMMTMNPNSGNNMGGVNMGMNPMNVNPNSQVKNDLNDINFSGMNMNSTTTNTTHVEEPPKNEPDAFKDIYMYSKQSKGNVTAGLNMKSNVNTQNNNMNSMNFDLSSGMGSNTTTTTNNPTTNTTSSYNPFDFY